MLILSFATQKQQKNLVDREQRLQAKSNNYL
jgi:hypothetical protein